MLCLLLLCALELSLFLHPSPCPEGFFFSRFSSASLVLLCDPFQPDLFFHGYLPLPSLLSLDETLLAKDFLLLFADTLLLCLLCSLLLSGFSCSLLALSVLLLLALSLCLLLLGSELVIPLLLLFESFQRLCVSLCLQSVCFLLLSSLLFR